MNEKEIPESAVINECKEVIKAYGLKLQRINTGCFKVDNRYIKTAEAGTCDFEGYDKHGRFLAVECKRPVGGKLSSAQELRINDINKVGGVAIVVHSGAELIELLKQRGCL